MGLLDNFDEPEGDILCWKCKHWNSKYNKDYTGYQRTCTKCGAKI